LCRPRQWGACWLVLTLWRELQLDQFWTERLPASRKWFLFDNIPGRSTLIYSQVDN